MTDNNSSLFWSRENLPYDLFILLEKLSNNKNIKVQDLYVKHQNTLEKKKKGTSKKESMILKNKERIQIKNLVNDKERIKNFIEYQGCDFENWLNYLETDLGREELKIEAIKKFIKSNQPVKKIELLIQIDKERLTNESSKKFLGKQLKKIKKLNLKRIQLKCLGNRLPPLDYYNKTEFNLEDWQINVIEMITNNKSVLVCAPTSSGKTIISTYFSEIGKKIIYVVPSKPLAFQVASLFYKIVNENISIYVDDFSYTSATPQFIVGTPYELESKLLSLDLDDVDLMVYDEIHNLNYQHGDCYERIIKLVDCNFLALSATIENSSELVDWWKNAHPKRKIEIVNYKNRFLNIQRYYWSDENSKIVKLNPLSCLNKNHLLEKQISQISLPFTPWDSFNVWDSFKEYDIEKYNKLDPEVIFQDQTIISLNDSKYFEELIKKNLLDLPDETKLKILDKHYVEQEKLTCKFSIFNLVKKLKKNKMNPSIIFNECPLECFDMFSDLMIDLENLEIENYPYHYTNLEFKQQMFLDYKNRRTTLDEGLKANEKYQKLTRFDEKELLNYKEKLTDNYQKQINKLQKGLDTKMNIRLLANLKESYQNDMELKCIEEVDVFEKHQDFSFNKEPMKSFRIRQLKKEISDKLDIKIKYTNLLIQGLKRGIGIYTKNLPDIYLRIVQELAHTKDLGIVISDDSLALGINMPFKTVVIAGWKDSKEFDKLIYHQMIGRAGRRGLDSEGNVIYANVDWKNIISNKMNKIDGLFKIPKHYGIASYFNHPLIDIEKANLNYLYNFVNKKEDKLILSKSYRTIIYEQANIEIVWKLRYIENIVKVVEYINYLEMSYKDSEINKKIIDRVMLDLFKMVYLNRYLEPSYEKIINQDTKDFFQSQDNLCQKFYHIICNNYLDKTLLHDDKTKLIKEIKMIGNLSKIIYNKLIKTEINYSVKDIFKKCFISCKTIMYKYLELN